MKKTIYIILSAAAIIACAKENDFSNKVDYVNEDGFYTLTAHLDDMTKASISTDGVFSWSGVDIDKIAVWDAVHSEYVTFTLNAITDAGKKEAKFTTAEAKTGASFEGQTAYYPASVVSTGSYVFPRTHNSIDDAAKSFPMQGTVSGNEIHFDHLGSMINLTLSNVPSFTRELVLNDETENEITVAITSAEASTGSISAVVPVPAGTYVLTAKLKDDNNNIFYTKPRESKTYTARNYYTIKPISLGKLLTFTNEAGWDSPKVHIWQYGNSGNVDITTGGTYPHKLYLRNSNVYYVLLDKSVESWTAEGNAIGVQFVSTTNASNTTQTDCVYLFRNIDFTIPGGGGLKTSYRTYLKVNNGSWANDAGAKIRDRYNTPTSFTSMTELNTKLYYYEWPVNYYGYGLYVEMQNSSNTDWYVPDRTDDGKTTNWWSFTLNRDLMYIRD